MIGSSAKFGPDASKLRIEIGEDAALQQRIVGEVDARHDVAHAEGNLLGFGEVVVRVAVERHLADRTNGDQLLRDDLGRVQDVEVEGELVVLVNDLDAHLPFQEVAALDRLEHVTAIEVGILAGNLLGFVPDEASGRPSPASSGT